jgi:uncharacterized protein YdaU (DUF1376 family)
MSNRAWMPLHIDDYLADTDYLSATEHGAYLLLIMKYWRDGGLPNDEGMIRRYAKLSPEQWLESRDVIAAFFDADWKHGRIDAELAKADEIIEKRRSAAFSRHGKSKPDASAEQVHITCSDTGVPPFTDNLSSLRSEDASASDFEKFWSVYPNKIGQTAAEKAFSKALKRSSIETIVAGAAAYAAKTDDRQWCNPVKWLSEDRWKDQPAQPPDKPAPKSIGLSHLQKPQSREEYLADELRRSKRSFER